MHTPRPGITAEVTSYVRSCYIRCFLSWEGVPHLLSGSGAEPAVSSTLNSPSLSYLLLPGKRHQILIRGSVTDILR